MNCATKNSKAEFYLKKLRFITFAAVLAASFALLLINVHVISNTRQLNKKEEAHFLQITRNALQDFHDSTKKEIELISTSVSHYQNCKIDISQIENLLNNGSFTFIDNSGQVFFNFYEFERNHNKQKPVNAFVMDKITNGYSIVHYHTKMKNKNSKDMGYVFYAVSLAALIEKIHNAFSLTKDAPSFFILDRDYNEIYTSNQNKVKKRDKFCSRVSSPFAHTIYLCSLHNNNIYRNLLVINFMVVPLLFVILLVVYFLLKNIEEEIYKKRSIDKKNVLNTSFLSCITHEMRTPLSIIISFSEMMKNEDFGPMHNKTYLNYSKEINQHCNSLLCKMDKIMAEKDSDASSKCT